MTTEANTPDPSTPERLDGPAAMKIIFDRGCTHGESTPMDCCRCVLDAVELVEGESENPSATEK